MTQKHFTNHGDEVLAGVGVSELTHANDGAAMFFDGPPKEQQKMFEKLVKAAKVVSIARGLGHNCDIIRTYSEGATNHGQGDTIDVAPHSRDYEECLALAMAFVETGRVDQVWIEATDDMGNFHVHVKSSGEVNLSPDLKTITNPEGGGGSSGFLDATVEYPSMKKV